MSENAFPVFKGCTRSATFWGIPVMPLLILLMTIASFALLIHWCVWVLALPGMILFRVITWQDDQAFRILSLWCDTCLRNRQRRFWRASSYSPVRYGRQLG